MRVRLFMYQQNFLSPANHIKHIQVYIYGEGLYTFKGPRRM